MRLNELLAVCREQVDAEMEVMISGEGIIGNPAMLEALRLAQSPLLP